MMELQQRRLQLEKVIYDASAELGKLKSSCQEHSPSKTRTIFSPRYNKVITYDSEYHVFCEICDADFGWYCPDNPKGYCEYDDANDESGEYCIHCGQPEDRN